MLALFADTAQTLGAELADNGVQVGFIGERARFPAVLRAAMSSLEKMTAAGNRLRVTVAVSYSGRWDILQAAQKIAAANGDFSEDNFSRYLSTNDLPPIDLLIRTGGERRISNLCCGKPPIPNCSFRQLCGRILAQMILPPPLPIMPRANGVSAHSKKRVSRAPRRGVALVGGGIGNPVEPATPIVASANFCGDNIGVVGMGAHVWICTTHGGGLCRAVGGVHALWTMVVGRQLKCHRCPIWRGMFFLDELCTGANVEQLGVAANRILCARHVVAVCCLVFGGNFICACGSIVGGFAVVVDGGFGGIFCR